MKVLFLDIDGVLNTPHSRKSSLRSTQAESLDPSCLQRLYTLLTHQLDLRIVLITTWLRWRSVEEITGMLQVPAHRVIGGINHRVAKAAGITDWLFQHPGVKSYAILDDQPLGHGAPLARQVWVFGDMGLSDHDVDQVLKLLTMESHHPHA